MAVSGSWEERLFALFDDLEQQAEAAYGLERDLEVGDRARAEYAGVPLAARLMASVGADVRLELAGGLRVTGTLRRVATGWCLVEGPAGESVVRTAAVLSAHGVAERAVPEAAWPVAARLGLGSALRRLAESGEQCRLRLYDGSVHHARLGRVGADFVEAYAGESRAPALVPFTALAAVQSDAAPTALA